MPRTPTPPTTPDEPAEPKLSPMGDEYQEPDAPHWRALRAAIEAGKRDQALAALARLELEPELLPLFELMLKEAAIAEAEIARCEAAKRELPALEAELSVAMEMRPQKPEDCAVIGDYRRRLNDKVTTTRILAWSRVEMDHLIWLQFYAPGFFGKARTRGCNGSSPPNSVCDWIRERKISGKIEGFRLYQRPTTERRKMTWIAQPKD